MDIIGGLVNGVLTALFLAFNLELTTGITLMWHFVCFPLLNPAVSFPHILTASGTVPPLNWYPNDQSSVSGDLQASVYASYAQELMDIAANLNIIFLDYIVVPVMAVFIIITALGHLLKIRALKREDMALFIPRLFFSIVLAYFSLYFASLVLYMAGALYNFIYYMNFGPNEIPGGSIGATHLVGIGMLGAWPVGNTNWLDFLQSNGLLIFIFLFTLFSIILILAVVIVIRLVWIFVTVLLLPVGALFLMFAKTQNFGKRIWRSFIEKAFEIFFIGIPLIFLNYFSDPLWSMAVFVVALSMPKFISIGSVVLGYPSSGSLAGRGVQIAMIKATANPLTTYAETYIPRKNVSQPMNLLGTLSK